uniref:Zgc:100829 n=1 Tax=Amphilophus citrinellus TaxID=61819 RepID=A0A3Q0R4T9_AMPCI
MLQQILKDMYIDPDVLEALNEEQKKTLFLKMREEQVRRWKEREEKLEREGEDAESKREKPNPCVSWQLGRDGDVAVIVIGEVDELSSKFICSGFGEKKTPSLKVQLTTWQSKLYLFKTRLQSAYMTFCGSPTLCESQEIVLRASCPFTPSLSADRLSPGILLPCAPACLSCRTPHSSLSREQLNCPVLPLAPSLLQPCVIWGVGLLYTLAFFSVCMCVCVCAGDTLCKNS